MLLATAVGAGVVTVLVLYFCSQKKENQQQNGTSARIRGTEAKAKVSIVQSYKQQHKEPYISSNRDKHSMGNSQSDDVIAGDSRTTATDSTTGQGNTNKSGKSSTSHTVRYSSSSGVEPDKCSVNREDSIESKEDHIDGSSLAFDSVDHKVMSDNTSTELCAQLSSGTAYEGDKETGRTSDPQCNIGHTNGDNKDDVHLLQKDDISTEKGLYDDIFMKQETVELKSGVNKKVSETLVDSESFLSGEVEHKSALSPNQTLSLADDINSTLVSINKSNITIPTTTTSFSTEVGSHKHKEGNDISGLKSNWHSKEPGSSSTFRVQSSTKGGSLSLSGDLNDKDTADCKQGSLQVELKDSEVTLNSERKSIDSLSLSPNNNSPQCQTHKSPILLEGQTYDTENEDKDSSLTKDTVAILSQSVASANSSGNSFQRMDTSGNRDEEDKADVVDISSVPLRAKRKSPNKRDAFILADTDTGLTKDVIGQWITKQHILIAENSGSKEEDEDSSSGNVFCSQISSDCKVIFSQHVSQKNPSQGVFADKNMVLCSEPVKMSEKACQTEERERGQGEGHSGESNQDLEDALYQINKLKEENQRLQQELVNLTVAETGLSKEENNNIQSESNIMKTEIVTSLQGQCRQASLIQEATKTRDDSVADLPAKEEESGTNIDTSAPVTEMSSSETHENDIVETFHECSDMEELVSQWQGQPEDIKNDRKTEIVQSADISQGKEENVMPEESEDVYHDVEDQISETATVELRSKNTGAQKCGTIEKKKRESSFFDDVSLPSSPHESAGGFSFDDVLKANLEYLSDDDDLFGPDLFPKSNNTTAKVEEKVNHLPALETKVKPEQLIDTKHEVDAEPETRLSADGKTAKDHVKTSDTVHTSVESSKSTLGKDGASSESICKVSNSAKFWETKLTTMHRDKTVAGTGENVNIDLNSIENIQKTKLLWEEKQTGSPPSEEAEVRPSEFSDDRLTASIRQTKMQWEERMTSEQSSGNNSSRRRSLEDLNNPSNGSDLEESLGSASKILQKKLLWEGLNISPNSSFRGDSPPKRLTLDYESDMDKKDVSKTKMKWEEMLENKSSPETTRKLVRLVSKSDFELELEAMSCNVEIPSISDVSNTKSKFEKMFSSSDDISCASPERLRRSERRSQSPMQGSRNVLFSSLKNKFEGPKKEDANGKMRCGSSLDDVRRPKSKVNSSLKAEDLNVGNENVSLDQSKEEDPFLSLGSDGGKVEGEESSNSEITQESVKDKENVSETPETEEDVKDCAKETGDSLICDEKDECKVICDSKDDMVDIDDKDNNGKSKDIDHFENSKLESNQTKESTEDDGVRIDTTKNLDAEANAIKARDNTREITDTILVDDAISHDICDDEGSKANSLDKPTDESVKSETTTENVPLCSSETGDKLVEETLVDVKENEKDKCEDLVTESGPLHEITEEKGGSVDKPTEESDMNGTDSIEEMKEEVVVTGTVQKATTGDNGVLLPDSQSNGSSIKTVIPEAEAMTAKKVDKEAISIYVKDTDTDDVSEGVKGSSEQFCDSELEFVKGNETRDYKVDLSDGERVAGEDETTSES